MPTSARFAFRLVPPALVAAGLLLATTLGGCGEPAAPALDKTQFDAAKKDREQIIEKEYGGAAFKKGTAKGAPKKK